MLPPSRLAMLPPAFTTDKPFATEFALALCQLPPDDEDKQEAYKMFVQDVSNRTLLLNVEYRANSLAHATLQDPTTKADIGKALIGDGFILCEKRREGKLAKLVEEYKEAEAAAKKAHNGIWEYGDITEDDAKEFGAGR